MKTTTIKQESNFYNPYFLDGKEIDCIVFYLEGEIVGHTNWFTSFGSNNDYPSFNLNEEIKLKRKIDLNSKDSFLAKTTENLKSYKNNYSLYINLANYNYELLGEDFKHETDYYKSYESKLNIILDSVKMECIYNKKTDSCIYTPTFDSHTITVKYGYRSEKKPKQLKVEKLEKLFKENNIKVGGFEIGQILDLCNLSVKRNK